MGFSLLSGAELLYYFTLRLFIDCRREKEAFRRRQEVEKLKAADEIPGGY